MVPIHAWLWKSLELFGCFVPRMILLSFGGLFKMFLLLWRISENVVPWISSWGVCHIDFSSRVVLHIWTRALYDGWGWCSRFSLFLCNYVWTEKKLSISLIYVFVLIVLDCTEQAFYNLSVWLLLLSFFYRSDTHGFGRRRDNCLVCYNVSNLYRRVIIT